MSAVLKQLRLAFYRGLVMPRKRAVLNGTIETAAASSTITANPTTPTPLSNASTEKVSGTKRKAKSPPPKADANQSSLSSATVLEDPADRDASPDSRESENVDLDSSDQATQLRQPAVNSDILPLPWKGRLGYAYSD